jgi:hypothetical protein
MAGSSAPASLRMSDRSAKWTNGPRAPLAPTNAARRARRPASSCETVMRAARCYQEPLLQPPPVPEQVRVLTPAVSFVMVKVLPLLDVAVMV